MVMMLAVQSGRNLTERYDFRQNTNMNQEKAKKADKISKELLIKMLKRENELRLSKEILQKYETEAIKYYDNNSNNNKLFISQALNNLQKKVVNEFGFGPMDKNEEIYGLECLRSLWHYILMMNPLQMQQII